MVIEFFSKTALFQYDVTGEGWEIYRNSQISVTDFPYFLNSSRSAAVWACIFAFHLWKWILHFIPYCYEWEIAQLVYGEICITPLLLSNTFEISWRNWSLNFSYICFLGLPNCPTPHPQIYRYSREGLLLSKSDAGTSHLSVLDDIISNFDTKGILLETEIEQ